MAIPQGGGYANDRSMSVHLESVHPGMGANLVGDVCSFRVWAPNAIAVAVCIWHDEQMSQVVLAPEPSNPSYWSIDVAGVVAGQPYQVSIVNKGSDPTNPGGILTRVDAYARQVESAEDNARGIVVDWQQEWSEFATPKFDDLIIYEAHVGSFAGLNDHLNISTYANIIAGLRENPDWRDKYFIAEWTSEQQDRWGQVICELGFNAVWGMSDPFAFIRAVNGENPIDNIKSFIGWMGFDRPWNFICYLLGSHDRVADSQSGKQPENRYFVELCGGRDNWYARAKARLGWALNVAMPGTPMLFMGSECHHWGYWWPNPDVNPATSEHRFDWAIAGDPIGIAMRNLVRDINWVRWHNPALRSDTLQFIHEDRTNTVLAFKRWNDEGNIIVVVVNLSDRQWQEHEYGIHMGGEIGLWSEIFNSQSPQYDGWNDSGNYGDDLQVQADGKLYINLPKWSILIFRKQ
jgi:1,4-alpha-glucan branching enzyme